jgi:uncharacterized tellurite resistance protein B-like protein
MLRSIKRFFDERLIPANQQQGMDDEHTLRLAVAALLLEVGESDYKDHPAERAAVMEAVKNHFGLEHDEADGLIELAESERAGATDYFQFTSLINRTYDLEQKKRLVEILWKVAFADDELHKYEEHLIRRLAELLHLPHRDFIAAKHRVTGAE